MNQKKIHYLTLFLFLLIPFSYEAQELNEEHISVSDSTRFDDERMPIFPGCEGIVDANEQAFCTEEKIINWVMSHAVYPEIAVKNGFKDKVFLTFIINTSGEVEDIEILKGWYESLNEAAIDAVKTLPKMTPAFQDGKYVKLKYTIPVSFTLGKSKPKKKDRKAKKAEKRKLKGME